jgi:hypothetical protein
LLLGITAGYSDESTVTKVCFTAAEGHAINIDIVIVWN